MDGVDLEAFEAHLAEHLAALQAELLNGTYRPQPVRRVLIPKPKEGLRPLAIWTLRDRVAQRAVHDWLEPQFEPEFLDCSHGFRPGRSVDTAVARVLKARDEGRRWVFDADIKECFDQIDAGLLMVRLRAKVHDRTILRLLALWLDAHILSADGRVRTAGAAQGGVLSPLLCNIYLHEFDRAMTRGGRWLVRYADDLVVLCRQRQEAGAAWKEAERALRGLRLELHPTKTRLVNFDQGFKFLGVFFIRGEHYYL